MPAATVERMGARVVIETEVTIARNEDDTGPQLRQKILDAANTRFQKGEHDKPVITGIGYGRKVAEAKRVMVLNEHHGDRHLDVSSVAQLRAVSLSILKGRFSGHNDYYPLQTFDQPLTEPSFTWEQIQAMREGPVKRAAQEEYEGYQNSKKFRESIMQQQELIKKAIAEDNGALAYRILELRRTYADEHFEIITVDDEYKP